MLSTSISLHSSKYRDTTNLAIMTTTTIIINIIVIILWYYLHPSSNVINCLYFRSNIPIPLSSLIMSLLFLPLASSPSTVHLYYVVTLRNVSHSSNTLLSEFLVHKERRYLLYSHSFLSCDIALLIKL